VKELSPRVRILYNCPSRREIFPVAFLSSLADGRDHEFTFSSSDGMKKTSKKFHIVFFCLGVCYFGNGAEPDAQSPSPQFDHLKIRPDIIHVYFLLRYVKRTFKRGWGRFLCSKIQNVFKTFSRFDLFFFLVE
jgi:hypothetical protein